MTRPLAAWVMWFLFLLLLGFGLPFLLLEGVTSLAGSFLFWTVWALVAIVSMFAAFLQWKDSHDDRLSEE